MLSWRTYLASTIQFFGSQRPLPKTLERGDPELYLFLLANATVPQPLSPWHRTPRGNWGEIQREGMRGGRGNISQTRSGLTRAERTSSRSNEIVGYDSWHYYERECLLVETSSSTSTQPFDIHDARQARWLQMSMARHLHFPNALRSINLF